MLDYGEKIEIPDRGMYHYDGNIEKNVNKGERHGRYGFVSIQFFKYYKGG